MSGLELERVTRRYGSVHAVDEVSLEVPDGTFVCLLGPSGCGKTTLLRIIAGLETPTSGEVRLDGRDLADLPTHRRDLGMVFQSLALFPHLDVGDNIAYALAIRGRPRAERRARVAELLELVRLPGIERRAVSALSGGQRQRVAIARALALSPRLFLLDEPLSALDAKLRETMQIELRELQQRLGVTTIVVTHDQREAMTMADLIVVMGEGRVRQMAPPVEIYRRPADAFVADFVGQTNLLPAEVDGGGIRVLGRPVPGLSPPSRQAGGDGYVLSVRPEDVRLVADDTVEDSSAHDNPVAGDPAPPAADHGTSAEQHDVQALFDGTVHFVRDLGASVETFVDVEGHELVAVAMPRQGAVTRVGDRVGVSFDAVRAVVLPR